MATAQPRASVADFLGQVIPAASERIQRILDSVRTHLGMDVAFASEITGGRRVFRHVSAASEAPQIPVGASDPLEETYCQRVVDGRLPQIIHDAVKEPEAAALPVTAALPVGAHLAVPLRLSDGRLYGTFCCFSSNADPSLNRRDLAMLQAFADLAAAEIEAQLREGEGHEESIREISQVIADRAVTMVYQPIYDLEAGAIGVEALARFHDWEQRPPSDWFERAHQVGLGVELELVAARVALAGLPYLPRDLYLSVNFSPEAVLSGRIESLLAEAPPGRLVIEVTEHAAIKDYGTFAEALEPLRRRARVAVDDVGAGYAGLRHILDLAPDIIKLDTSLVRGIDQDPARRALALAMIAFASGIDSTIVAEGVENASELAVLRELGVAKAQGYHLSRPLPLMAVQQFLYSDGRTAPPDPIPASGQRTRRRRA